MSCDNCEDGYTYSASIVGDGEPTRSACPECRPDEAAHEANVAGVFLLLLMFVPLLLAMCSEHR